MTDAATIAHARKNGTTIEVKKHAYRQTQDGIVISFVMHPNDVTAALATAPLGTRYLAVLFEAGDDIEFNAGAEISEGRVSSPKDHQGSKPHQAEPVREVRTSFNAGAEPASSTPAVSDSPTAQTRKGRSQSTTPTHSDLDREPHQAAHAPPSGGDRRKWDELPYPTQAAIRCQEAEFIKFLGDYCRLAHIDTAEDAAWAVRDYCGVTSRRDIVPMTEAGGRWKRLDSDYLLWREGARV